jgi:hypothetical protein
MKIYMEQRLTTILREEEIRLFQWAKVKHLLEGDNNTKYFQLVANGKHQKQRIFSLEDDEGNCIEEGDLKHHITNYYKTLFGKTDHNSVIMEESITYDISQVPDIENAILTALFTMDEVRKTVFQMERNKAPGPDGFPAEFYQTFWEVIKDDLLALFVDFHNDTLPVYSLNFGVINLLPKKCNASKIQEYGPICLLNVSFKIITKFLTNRIGVVADKLINPSQTAFMPGRNILEGVIMLHETIHELQRKKLNGLILKLDFEKAYDKVNWSFLQQALRMKGFSPKWCAWIQSIVSRGHVGIKINDEVGPFFTTHKGLRQGDPLSPILFNIVVDMLAILFSRAKEDNQFAGVVPHLMEGGLSILQYADDTIVSMDHNLEHACNVKLLLTAFEQMSGLKINFHKSELFCYGLAKEYDLNYSRLFGCGIGSLPFKYLGIPMTHRRLQNSEWHSVIDRLKKY